MSTEAETFASAFRSARIERGHSQTEAALALGVSREAVSQWESGSNSPSDRRWATIADYIGVDWRRVEELVAAAHRQRSL